MVTITKDIAQGLCKVAEANISMISLTTAAFSGLKGGERAYRDLVLITRREMERMSGTYIEDMEMEDERFGMLCYFVFSTEGSLAMMFLSLSLDPTTQVEIPDQHENPALAQCVIAAIECCRRVASGERAAIKFG